MQRVRAQLGGPGGVHQGGARHSDKQGGGCPVRAEGQARCGALPLVLLVIVAGLEKVAPRGAQQRTVRAEVQTAGGRQG